MIKLILKLGSKQTEKVFLQDSVLIGTDSADFRDLPFDTSSLASEHVSIFMRDGIFYAHNITNDPFVTSNGRPFGKKKLNSGDRLTIGDIEILFEGEYRSLSQTPVANKGLNSLSESLDRSIMKKAAKAKHEAIIEEDEDLEALIREVERFEAQTELEKTGHDPSFKVNSLQGSVAAVQARIGRETLQKQSLQSDDNKPLRSLRERRPIKPKLSSQPDETSQAVRHHFGTTEAPRRSFWRPLFLILVVFVAIMAAVGSGIYFTFSEKSDEQEFIAAQGLADMSMALTYAQLHQIKPPNQNWGDPDFLNESLAKILPPAYPSLASIDKQGNFTDCPYMLRIYTSGDLSQFLLIAQPAPSLWQWLFSRETILLDSRSMELRKTMDLRALNRLLANSKPLEGANALEVSHLVNQSALIRLTSLATETGYNEFLPPKGLNKLRPGAETHIYNAPRYYRMSSPIVQNLAILATGSQPASEEESQEWRKRVTDFSKLSNAVLYSTENEVTTRKVSDLLKSWLPEQVPIVAQLHLDSDTGRVLSSYLLINKPFENHDEESPPSPQTTDTHHDISMMDSQTAEPSLQSHLRQAINERSAALELFKQQINKLINDQIASPHPDFAELVSQFVSDLTDADLSQLIDIRHTVADAYRSEVLENNTLNHDEFVQEAKAAGAEPFLPVEFLQEPEPEEPSPAIEVEPVTSEDSGIDFGTALHNVKHAHDFESLDEAILEANEKLVDLPVSGDEKSLTLRNKLQIQAIHKLEQLILGASSRAPDSTFNQHNRSRIQHILANVGIVDQEELDYYIHEFDLVVQQKHRLSDD